MVENLKDSMIENVEAAATDNQAGEQDSNPQEPEQEKKYTDADLDRIIARKIAAERKRMSKLFSEEQQETELETRERKVLERELKADAKDRLIEQGFPSCLANLMVYTSAEDHKKSFDEVTSVFSEALSNEFKKRLSGTAPRAGMGTVEINREKALHDVFSSKAQ